MRKTTLLLTEHLYEPLALIVESYIISFTNHPCDLASAGHWEILDQMMMDSNDDYSTLSSALYGAARGDSLELVQHILDLGCNNYSYGLLGACCGKNLDAAKLIRKYQIENSEFEFAIFYHMNAIGEYSGSVEMFNWFCDSFNPAPELISETLFKAIKSQNMAMISAALSRGGEIKRSMMFAAGESGSLAMVVLLSQYEKNYNDGFTGACSNGHLNLIKWFMRRGVTNFDRGFRNAALHLNAIKYIATNAKILDNTFTYVIMTNIHSNDTTEYERIMEKRIRNIPDESRNAAIQNSKAIIRWILDEYPDRVNLDTLCWTCKNNLRNHRWIAQ